MPNSSYIVSGQGVEADGGAAGGALKIIVWNKTKNEFYYPTNSDASGNFSLDLANLTTQWVSTDWIIITWHRNFHYGEYRFQPTGVSLAINPRLNVIGSKPAYQTVRLQTITVSENSGTAREIKLYDRNNNEEVLSIPVAANGFESAYFGPSGKTIDGGFVVVCPYSGDPLAGVNVKITTKLI